MQPLDNSADEQQEHKRQELLAMLLAARATMPSSPAPAEQQLLQAQQDFFQHQPLMAHMQQQQPMPTQQQQQQQQEQQTMIKSECAVPATTSDVVDLTSASPEPVEPGIEEAGRSASNWRQRQQLPLCGKKQSFQQQPEQPKRCKLPKVLRAQQLQPVGATPVCAATVDAIVPPRPTPPLTMSIAVPPDCQLREIWGNMQETDTNEWMDPPEVRVMGCIELWCADVMGEAITHHKNMLMSFILAPTAGLADSAATATPKSGTGLDEPARDARWPAGASLRRHTGRRPGLGQDRHYNSASHDQPSRSPAAGPAHTGGISSAASALPAAPAWQLWDNKEGKQCGNQQGGESHPACSGKRGWQQQQQQREQ